MSDTSARYHVVGVTELGPMDRPVLITSGADYHYTFGERTEASARVYDDVSTFIAEGGRQVWISRVPSLDVTTVRQALTRDGEVTAGAAVAVPGGTAGALGRTLMDHAAAHGKIALLNAAQDSTAEQAAGSVAHLIGAPGSDHAAVFWPWLTAPGPGRARYIPPTGYVAAARARAHYQRGHAWTPAGRNSITTRFPGLRSHNIPTRNEELSEQLISPLVTTRHGVELHGWWSLSGDRGNFAYLDVRDMLNQIAVDLGEAYDRINPHSWDTMAKLVGQITTATRSILASMSKDGAFTTRPSSFNVAADPGYIYTIGPAQTQPTDRNVVIVRIAVRPYPHANLVGVRVFRVPILDTFQQEALT